MSIIAKAPFFFGLPEDLLGDFRVIITNYN